jgi:hypothetical protein
LPSEVLAIRVPLPSQQEFFAAIRTFAEAHGYSVEEGTYTFELGTARGFILSGLRSQIQISSGRGDREFSAIDFQAFFYASRLVEFWGLTESQLSALIGDFLSAIETVDGLAAVRRGTQR